MPFDEWDFDAKLNLNSIEVMQSTWNSSIVLEIYKIQISSETANPLEIFMYI